MKTLPAALLLPLVLAACQASAPRPDARSAALVSLDGAPCAAGNPIGADGRIREFHAPVLRLMRTQAKAPRGTVLVFPGGGYGILAVEKEGVQTGAFLNAQGFDAAILEYPVAPGGGSAVRDRALADARTAWELLRREAGNLGLHGGRLGMMGFSAGGHLAARLAQSLPAAAQPDDLVLVYPAYLDETAPGSALPTVLPTTDPRRLFMVIAKNDHAAWVNSAEIYAKTFVGYGGEAKWRILPDGGHGFGMGTAGMSPAAATWPTELAAFLAAAPAPTRANSAVVPVPQPGTEGRHAQKVAQAQAHRYGLLMIGDSITHSLGEAGGKYEELRPVFRQYYEPRDALNLGYSGARTENILWNLEHGELENQAPKAVILMIGTNNVDEKHYRRSTARELADGTAAIVALLRRKLPDAKILLLRPFPGSYDGDRPTSHRLILERAGDLLRPLADGKQVFYCDVNPAFLAPDGALNPALFFDHLHPNGAGAKKWAEAMEPMLAKLMGDAPVPANPALAPVPKLEESGYDWHGRHEAVVREQKALDPDLVFIGDSITHAWGGVPKAGLGANWHVGEAAAAKAFAGHRVLNCGFGWDRTQNVLWRLDHGELDGLRPKTVVIHIGTNNLTPTKNAGPCTPEEIAQGVLAVCGRVRAKCPGTKIMLMAVFPRWTPAHPGRATIAKVNQLLADAVKLRQAQGEKIVLRDLGPDMLQPDGTFKPGVMAGDLTHLVAGGYEIWAKAVKAELE